MMNPDDLNVTRELTERFDQVKRSKAAARGRRSADTAIIRSARDGRRVAVQAVTARPGRGKI